MLATLRPWLPGLSLSTTVMVLLRWPLRNLAIPHPTHTPTHTRTPQNSNTSILKFSCFFTLVQRGPLFYTVLWSLLRWPQLKGWRLLCQNISLPSPWSYAQSHREVVGSTVLYHLFKTWTDATWTDDLFLVCAGFACKTECHLEEMKWALLTICIKTQKILLKPMEF